MSGEFSHKIVEIELTLANGGFQGGGNSKTLTGYAVDVSITKDGFPSKNAASVTIYGMKAADMDAFTFLSFENFGHPSNNKITIKAGDSNGLATVFFGDVANACADYSSYPDISFKIDAVTQFFSALQPMPPSSYNGAVDVTKVAADLADKMDLKIISTVNTKISGLVLTGAPLEQLDQLCTMSNVRMVIDDKTLYIEPMSGQPVIDTSGAVTISKGTGLIGYPTFAQNGVEIDSVFNPNFLQYGLISLESIVPRASGIWKIWTIRHNLQTQNVGDSWNTKILAVYPSAKNV